ncbi:MAG: hypothetical protein OXT67_06025, partial [Zetaproteobacteria bacterium]|nr:hypothetical protein [Zetaproteobacteria bacterium]
MEVKTFEGFSTREIMKKIKKEFGKNAVILSTQEKEIEDSNTKLIQVRAAVGQPERKGASTQITSPTFEDSDYQEQLKTISRRLDLLYDYTASHKKIETLENHLQELKIIMLQNM